MSIKHRIFLTDLDLFSHYYPAWLLMVRWQLVWSGDALWLLWLISRVIRQGIGIFCSRVPRLCRSWFPRCQARIKCGDNLNTRFVQFPNINLLMRKHLNPRVLITLSEGGDYIIICQEGSNDISFKLTLWWLLI